MSWAVELQCCKVLELSNRFLASYASWLTPVIVYITVDALRFPNASFFFPDAKKLHILPSFALNLMSPKLSHELENTVDHSGPKRIVRSF